MPVISRGIKLSIHMRAQYDKHTWIIRLAVLHTATGGVVIPAAGGSIDAPVPINAVAIAQEVEH